MSSNFTSVPYRAIVLQKPYFADLLSQGIELEFCLCIYQFSCFKQIQVNEKKKYTIETMDHDKLQNCIYDVETINMIPPVDRYILESMKTYESEILSIIYRWHNLTYPEAKKHYYQHLRFWSWYLNNKRINLFIGVVPHETYYAVIYYLCKLMSIKTVLFHPLSISNFFTIMEDWRVPDQRVKALYHRYLKNPNIISTNNWSPEFLEFINNQIFCLSPSYMKQSLEKLRKSKLIDLLISLIFKLKIQTTLTDLILKNLLKLMYKYNRCRALYRSSLHRIIRDQLADFVFDLYYESLCTILNTSELENEEYIYVSLHYQPECTTLPLGDFFESQQMMIDWLSYSRPKNVWLYIKEHPAQTYQVNTSRYRHPDFYSDILKIPRVRLVSRHCSSFHLIRNSVCVSTITGTVALESLYQEKPVLTFGYHVYQYAPGVFPIRTLSDCSSVLQKIFKREIYLKKEHFMLYLKALEKNCIKFNQSEFVQIKWNQLGDDDKMKNQFLDHLLNFLEYNDCAAKDPEQK